VGRSEGGKQGSWEDREGRRKNYKLQTEQYPTGILGRLSDGKHIVYTNWKRWECRSGVDKVYEDPGFKSFNQFHHQEFDLRGHLVRFVRPGQLIPVFKDTSLASGPCNHPQSNSPLLKTLLILT
jgi:hypothetical protein